jgi:hypothetical protein
MSQELMNNVRDWLLEDNEIMQLDAELKEKKKKRKIFANLIIKTMEESLVDSLNIKGGKINYKKKEIKKQLNNNHLLYLLQEYFKNTPEEANNLYDYLQNNKEIKVEEKLTRSFH